MLGCLASLLCFKTKSCKCIARDKYKGDKNNVDHVSPRPCSHQPKSSCTSGATQRLKCDVLKNGILSTTTNEQDNKSHKQGDGLQLGCHPLHNEENHTVQPHDDHEPTISKIACCSCCHEKQSAADENDFIEIVQLGTFHRNNVNCSTCAALDRDNIQDGSARQWKAVTKVLDRLFACFYFFINVAAIVLLFPREI